MSTSAGQYQPSGSPVTAGGMYGQAPPRGGAGGYGGAPGGASGMPPGAGQAVQQFWIPNELVGPSECRRPAYSACLLCVVFPFLPFTLSPFLPSFLFALVTHSPAFCDIASLRSVIFNTEGPY